MIRKRIVGVITVRRGVAVQSFGYRRWLPLGKPEVLAKNLDRWGADEILLQVIDRTSSGAGPDIELLGRLRKIGLSTPLIYGGGIGSASDAERVVNSAADRICVDALLRDDPDEVEKISSRLGAQAIIAALPLVTQDRVAYCIDYRDGTVCPFPRRTAELISGKTLSEALIIDWRNEGYRASFDSTLIDLFPVPNAQLIVFGGLSEPDQLRRVLNSSRVSAAAVGNFLNYKEHAIQRYRELVGTDHLRPPIYDQSDRQ
jgi:imidazole glycerol-phosphate synthase subunit HisF